MKNHLWPDGTTKSQGNAFDLSSRTHSIFFDPKRPLPTEQKRGKGEEPRVRLVKGLSKRACVQLQVTPNSTSIGKRAA